MLISNEKTIGKYYNALIEKNSQFIGTFFVGVKTTGIFCISTCTARKPKLKNVLFYTTSKELLQNGFRPCKICKPTNHAFEPPKEVIKAIELVYENPFEKIKDYHLKLNGLRPEMIRRWFKKHHGITFHAYQRMIRINSAFQELKDGKNVTSSALQSSYESLSGFAYTFKNMIGTAPKNSKCKNVILISRLTTPIGPMFVCSTEKGICLLEFTDRKMLETEFKDIQKRLTAVILSGENEHIKLLKQELKEYFNGLRFNFAVKIDAPGTDFQKSAWDVLQNIPYGQTRSYQELAIKLNKPKAVRAVASANGHNRISIVIPCHRVIGKDGSLTGYGGGLERKRWLLDHERSHLNLK